MTLKGIRQDLQFRDKAKDLGYSEDYDVTDKRGHRAGEFILLPHFPIVFKRGNRTVWLCSKGWALAWLTGDGKLVSGRYRHHMYFNQLIDALSVEKSKHDEE